MSFACEFDLGTELGIILIAGVKCVHMVGCVTVSMFTCTKSDI